MGVVGRAVCSVLDWGSRAAGGLERSGSRGGQCIGWVAGREQAQQLGEGEFEATESGGELEAYGPVVQETEPACAERREHSRPEAAVLRDT